MATIAEKRTVERVWLKSYPPGVPAEADVDRYANVPQLLGESCRKFAAQAAFTCMDATIDFATLMGPQDYQPRRWSASKAARPAIK